jgi:hypothetical protein
LDDSGSTSSSELKSSIIAALPNKEGASGLKILESFPISYFFFKFIGNILFSRVITKFQTCKLWQLA